MRPPGPSEWGGSALCAQVDHDLFFPDKDDWAAARDAKAVCHQCPVESLCREWAVANTDLVFGIFGGTSPKQRSRLRVARGAA